MAIITTSKDLGSVTYTRGEVLDIRNGATLTISTTPTVNPGNIQCTTSGKLRTQNSSATVPLVLTLDDMNNDFRFEAGGVLEFRGAPMQLGTGTGAAQTFDFKTLFGGVIPHMTYVEVEEAANSNNYMPWGIVDEDPKFNLDAGLNTTLGGGMPSSFTAGNTLAGRALFWHETNRTLRCGDGVNGAAIPTGCKIRIPNIYVTNRHPTNASRVLNIVETGIPTGGTFALEITSETGAVLGTTAAIPFNATSAQVATAIAAVTGTGTVSTGAGPLPTSALSVTWTGSLVTGFGSIPSVRVVNSALTGGTNPQVMLCENNAGNLSLIDISPLGTLDCEWVSFSHKIRLVADNFSSVRLISTGLGADSVQLQNSNGSVEIDGFCHSRSPFAPQSGSWLSAVYGVVSAKRMVSMAKSPGAGFSFSILPKLTTLENPQAVFFGKRTSGGQRALQLVTLPTGVKVKNPVSIGASMQCTNLTNPVITNYRYADGTLNVQETAQGISAIVTANVIEPIFAGFSLAGPQTFRGQLLVADSSSSDISLFDASFNSADSSATPVYLACAGATYQNISTSGVRAGPVVDTVSNWLANGSILRKVFCTFTTPQSATGLDASTGGQYDLVTSSITGLTESFLGVSDFVGGNYADPSLTPTSGHVTFGPFGAGAGLQLSGAAYIDALGAFYMPNAGDIAIITMPFAMHGITSFQNSNPFLLIDAPGAFANQHVVIAPGNPTGGTFTLTVTNAAGTVLGTTSALAFNAPTATVASAIEAISGIGTGQVSVAGTLGAGYTITFSGTLAGQGLGISVNGSALTGGTEPGVAYAYGRCRLLTGVESFGSAITTEFAVRVPGNNWNAYTALTGANLATALSALSGYQPGGSGLEMRVRLTALQTNPYTRINQVSLLTNVNPALWTLSDASITLQGPESSDIVRVIRSSDDAVLYSFTGGGAKNFVIGSNFDASVYFRRETASGRVLMTTFPATQNLLFGSNGTVELFYGAQVQVAQTTTSTTAPSVTEIRTELEKNGGKLDKAMKAAQAAEDQTV